MPDAPTVSIADHPQLRAIAWHLRDSSEISEREALSLYERNWRFVGDLDEHEAAFIQHLADTYSGGKLLV